MNIFNSIKSILKKGTYYKIDKDNKKRWYIDGILHREIFPAVECIDGYKAWYRYDRRHREDGPAIIWPNCEKEWWLNGVRLTEKEFNERKIK